jgi:putative SOS response-associated peptidase YedK
MCGRAYETYSDDELFFRYLTVRQRRNPLGLRPNYNLAPTQASPIVRVVNGARQIDLCQWGLIPPWEPEFKTKLSTINAKAETIFTSRLFRGPVAKQRCVVPLSGFIEWKRTGGPKRPFAIHLKDQAIMSVAGVWGTWGQGDDVRNSFAIVTTAANKFMEGIHNRMPVILGKDAVDAWLDPANG